MASHERRASSKGIRQQRDMEPAIGWFIMNFTN